MTRIRRFIDVRTAADLRAFLRAVTICVTAFWARLEPEQIGAVQMVAEAALQLFVRNPATPPPYPGGQ